MAGIATLHDDFDAASIDLGRWPGAAGEASQTGGRARIECGTGFARFVSAGAYTMEDSSVSVRAWPAENVAASQAWTQLVVMSSVDGTDLCMEMDAISGNLNLFVRFDYWDEFGESVAYDPDEHAWWRIREGGGNVRFETSPDGLAWTTQRTVATPSWVESEDAVAVQLIAHRTDGVADFAEFDDFNICYGSAALSGGGALVAHGQADSVPPVIAHTEFQILLGPRSGGYQAELSRAKNRKLSVRLEDPSEFSFDINGREAEATRLQELETDVHVRWVNPANPLDRQILFRGRLGTTQDNLTEDEHQISCTVLDYRALLRRRILYSDRQLTWTGVDQGEIAWGLLQQTQALNGGNLGIVKGWEGTTPTGYTQDREFEAGDIIADKIREVGEVEDGYEWDIVPVSASALVLQIWSPQRGNDHGVVLEFGGAVSRLTREVRPAAYANALRQTGADELNAAELEAPDISATGRWDAVFGDGKLEPQECVDKRAAWQLAESQVIRPTYTVILREGEWHGPEHIWLGDPVRLIIRSGRLATDVRLRVYGIQFDISDEGPAQVTLTLDRPPQDPRWEASEQDRRITNLERR